LHIRILFKIDEQFKDIMLIKFKPEYFQRTIRPIA
jgi:hypothetical protein